MNAADIVLILLIAAAVIGAVVHIVRRKRQGKGCGCGCAGCSGNCTSMQKK